MPAAAPASEREADLGAERPAGDLVGPEVPGPDADVPRGCHQQPLDVDHDPGRPAL